MISVYYWVCFAASLSLTLFYSLIWTKNSDIHFSIVFIIITVANLGYLLFSQSQTLEAALIANKIVYIGGCFIMVFVTIIVFRLCKIAMPKYVYFLMLVIAAALYMCVPFKDNFLLYYKAVDFQIEDGIPMLLKEYGPLHALFYIFIILCLAVGISFMIYAYLKQKSVSRKIIYLLVVPEIQCAMMFFVGRLITKRIELTAAGYVLSQIVYLYIIYRVSLYDVNEAAVDTLVREGNIALVSVDLKLNYLGSNENAKNFFPSLREMRIDSSILNNELFSRYIHTWISTFNSSNSTSNFYLEWKESIYLVSINYLENSGRKRGYHFYIKDITKEQKYIALLNKFNTSLQNEVDLKTRNLMDMQERLIFSMALMVESRDIFTGGHIKRTGDIIKIFAQEIRKNNTLGVTDQFLKYLVRGAITHDLGKISVDDNVLREQGLYSQEEFSAMKVHAAEGARIIRQVLGGVEEPAFVETAANMAHYHHERFDGTGYPMGLKGTEIPLEARIMAIVDVYDALVTTRVYKERLDFQQANSVILDGMGTLFDKTLEPFYIAARAEIEDYYRSLIE